MSGEDCGSERHPSCQEVFDKDSVLNHSNHSYKTCQLHAVTCPNFDSK